MSPSSSLAFLVVVMFVAGCYGDEGLTVKVNVKDGDVDISLQGLPDPCVGHECPEGEECRSIYHPTLLEVPIAHCVAMETDETKENNDPQQSRCTEVSVGTNIVNCKSESQWKTVGHTQCALRGGNDMPLLVKTNVQTACHSFNGGYSEPRFLQATFTCCAEDYIEQPTQSQAPPPHPPHHHNSHPPHHHNEPIDYQPVDGEEPTDDLPTITDRDASTYLFPVIGGVVLVLAIVAATLALCQRRRRVTRARNGLKTPQVILATSFINPNVDAPPTYDDEWLHRHHGNDDKSLLIVNESSGHK